MYFSSFLASKVSKTPSKGLWLAILALKPKCRPRGEAPGVGTVSESVLVSGVE